MTWLVCERCAQTLMTQWREEKTKDDARCLACKRADGHHCQVLVSAEPGLEAVAA